MTTLDGTSQQHDLGGGFKISAPGVIGDAVLQPPAAGTTRRSGGTAIDSLLVGYELDDVAEIDLEITQLAPASASRGGDEIVIEAPDLGPTVGQVMLSVDPATGLLSWHVPEGDVVRGTATRGGTQRFVLGSESLAAGAPSGTRGMLGWIGKKLLRVLVYPVTDKITGWIVDQGLSAWEARARPHGVRAFGPGAHRSKDWNALDVPAWQSLSADRALLFVHGTFSTGAGAFGALPDDIMAALSIRYSGRIAAFEHPTLSATPTENADWLAKLLEAASTNLDVDIVCHSRGGLVSRVLAERIAGASSRLKVGKVILVGVPNGGTPLADPQHMTDLLDQMTNLASGTLGAAASVGVFATGQAGDIIEAVLAVVKVLGRGLLVGASGLQSMDPKGALVRSLNEVAVDTSRYFAVCSDHEPSGTSVSALALRAFDAGMDRVFESAANDCVVPTIGMHTADKFVIAPERRVELLKADGVLHTRYFGSTSVGPRLLDLLQG